MSASEGVPGTVAGYAGGGSKPEESAELLRALFASRTAEELETIALIKRFIERFTADAALRTALAANPADDQSAVRALALPISVEAIRPVWDKDFATTITDNAWPVAKLWFDWIADIRTLATALSAEADTGGISPRFDAWHRRQVARTDSELGKALGLSLQPVVAFELSRGCSVGCWFCGVSAARFAGHWAYSPENAAVWRDSLHGLRELFGRGMKTGLCYWGTDPLDNPDYIHFASDYREIAGWLPPMTTAIPLRDRARTREVLQLRNAESVHNRFSVLTLRMLDEIHAEFSPMELLRIPLVMQMKGSLTPITVSGRALERAARKAGTAAHAQVESDEWAPGTIACVSGFLINMAEGTVRLITPCQATAANPRGYHVLAESVFAGADELLRAVNSMIIDHMPEQVADVGRLRFRSDLHYHTDDHGFRLKSKAVTHHVRGDAHIQRMGQLIAEGTHTSAEIASALLTDGGNILAINSTLRRLFDKGMFDVAALPVST